MGNTRIPCNRKGKINSFVILGFIVLGAGQLPSILDNNTEKWGYC